MVESGCLLSSCRRIFSYPGFESRSLRFSAFVPSDAPTRRTRLRYTLTQRHEVSPPVTPRAFFVASRRLLPLLAVLCLGAPGTAASASSGRQFVALRSKLHCDTHLTYNQVQADPSAYVGRVLELRGSVCGTMETASGLSILLNQPDKSAVNLDVPRSQAGPLMEGSTPHLRALVKVLEGSSGNVVALKVLAVAYDSEVDIAEREAASRAEAARRAAQIHQQNEMALQSRSSWRSRAGARRYGGSRAVYAARGGFSRSVGMGGDLESLARYYDPYLGPRVKPLFRPYCQFIAGQNSRLTADMAGLITASLLVYADRYNVDPRLIVAMIIAESNFNPEATSRVGAMGLGQLMPGTARSLGVNNAYDPVQNLGGSINYLRSRLDTFADKALPGGGVSLEQAAYALAAYNAGVGAVKKYHGIPPYRETQAYVRRIIDIYQQLCQGG